MTFDLLGWGNGPGGREEKRRDGRGGRDVNANVCAAPAAEEKEKEIWQRYVRRYESVDCY